MVLTSLRMIPRDLQARGPAIQAGATARTSRRVSSRPRRDITHRADTIETPPLPSPAHLDSPRHVPSVPVESPLANYQPRSPLHGLIREVVTRGLADGEVLVSPPMQRFARASFDAIAREGHDKLSSVLSEVARALDLGPLSLPHHEGIEAWQEQLSTSDNRRGVREVLVRFKGLHESVEKAADRLAAHVSTRAGAKPNEKRRAISDIFGVTFVVEEEQDAHAVARGLEALIAKTAGRFELADVKNMLAADGLARRSGWSALKMVLLADGFPIEVQIRSKAAVEIDRQSYLDPCEEAPSSHACYAERRTALREAALTDPQYRAVKGALSSLF